MAFGDRPTGRVLRCGFNRPAPHRPPLPMPEQPVEAAELEPEEPAPEASDEEFLKALAGTVEEFRLTPRPPREPQVQPRRPARRSGYWGRRRK